MLWWGSLSILIAVVALEMYGRDLVVAQDFALRKDDHRGYEEQNGARYTAAACAPIATRGPGTARHPSAPATSVAVIAGSPARL